jgi:signal transduction histidine kinase
LLDRLRWAVGLGVVGVVVATLAAISARPAVHGFRPDLVVKFGAAALATWELSDRRIGRAHAAALALAYVLSLLALAAVALRTVPGAGVVTPVCLASVMMATALFFPWGRRAQATVGIAGVAAYAWWVLHAVAGVNAAAVGLVVSTALVSIAAAEWFDRHRAGAFAGAWRQHQLLRLARVLAAEVKPEGVIAQVLEHGLRLVHADALTLATRDPIRGCYRVEAVTGGAAEDARLVIGLEVPQDIPLVEEIVGRGTLAVPEDGAGVGFGSLLGEHGVRHALCLAMRCGGEMVGILAFARREAEPFTAEDRELARGLADQSALALRTARLVADLGRANQLKSQFVSTMSHELRTPLTVILGFADMARDRGLGADERDECLGRIEAAGHDLLGLIEATLEIGRMEAGRGDLQLEPVELPVLWAELGEACQQMRHAADVRLEWGSEVPSISLLTDRRKLTAVVRNLVSNALKFTERGLVRVETGVEGDGVLVRVTDTGIGIPPEDHALVYEMFRQGDGSLSRRYEGTGVGLYIVRRFVEQLGGTVTLESDLGRGSVFTVRLPRAGVVPPLERAA